VSPIFKYCGFKEIPDDSCTDLLLKEGQLPLLTVNYFLLRKKYKANNIKTMVSIVDSSCTNQGLSGLISVNGIKIC
jgi:hypothetical protein